MQSPGSAGRFWLLEQIHSISTAALTHVEVINAGLSLFKRSVSSENNSSSDNRKLRSNLEDN